MKNLFVLLSFLILSCGSGEEVTTGAADVPQAYAVPVQTSCESWVTNVIIQFYNNITGTQTYVDFKADGSFRYYDVAGRLSRGIYTCFTATDGGSFTVYITETSDEIYSLEICKMDCNYTTNEPNYQGGNSEFIIDCNYLKPDGETGLFAQIMFY